MVRCLYVYHLHTSPPPRPIGWEGWPGGLGPVPAESVCGVRYRLGPYVGDGRGCVGAPHPCPLCDHGEGRASVAGAERVQQWACAVLVSAFYPPCSCVVAQKTAVVQVHPEEEAGFYNGLDFERALDLITMKNLVPIGERATLLFWKCGVAETFLAMRGMASPAKVLVQPRARDGSPTSQYLHSFA